MQSSKDTKYLCQVPGTRVISYRKNKSKQIGLVIIPSHGLEGYCDSLMNRLESNLGLLGHALIHETY